MCTNYTPATPSHLIDLAQGAGLGRIEVPASEWPAETFPGYLAPILQRDPDGTIACHLARFGLVPRWCRDAAQASALSRGTHNARTETAADKPSYRAPWRERRFALVPMLAYFEPCWESGRAVRWRLQRSDGAPFAVAALHERWRDPATGEPLRSFSLLTANADGHPLLRRMHRPGEEKRQLLVVPPAFFGRWMSASAQVAKALLSELAADDLVGEPAARPALAQAPRQQSLLDF